jgi:putative oxidoreductase
MSTVPLGQGQPTASSSPRHLHLTEAESQSILLPFFGRVFMSLIFIVSGFSKVVGYNAAVEYAKSHGMPLPTGAISAAIFIEFIGGTMILLGFRTRLAAIVIALFLVPTTLIFHNFWAYTGVEAQNLMFHFLKNLAIAGGLLMLAGYPHQPFSIDGALARPPEIED